MKDIKTVGIIGAGTMGAALACKFALRGLKVILTDISMTCVENEFNKIKTVLNERVEKHLFTYKQASDCLGNLEGTDNISDLKMCDLIVEAIYEDFRIKSDLLKELSSIVPFDTIIATNTSSFSITELSAFVKYPERFIGLHYFYPVTKNRLVEIIPGERTSKETIKSVFRFSIFSNNDPIYCIDAYGFAVNRFFIPWLNEAIRLQEENVASFEQIETVCKETFGIEAGPFELMNAFGISETYKVGKSLEIFGSLYKPSSMLKNKAKENQLWIYDKPDRIDVNIVRSSKLIKDRMLGVLFFVSSQILDEKICLAPEIDIGAKIGLGWEKGPVELMRELGENKVMRLIIDTMDLYHMNLPNSIGKSFWEVNNVNSEEEVFSIY